MWKENHRNGVGMKITDHVCIYACNNNCRKVQIRSIVKKAAEASF